MLVPSHIQQLLDDIAISEAEELDLVDEMEWEDHVVFLTLQEAGLEDADCFDTVQAAQKVYFDEEY